MMKNLAQMGLLCSAFYIPLLGAQPAGNWDVDGASGRIEIYGKLTESACRLDLGSAWQEVDLNTLTTAQLVLPGDEGTPVSFTLKLRDCIRSGTINGDRRLGNQLKDAFQPSVAVTFLAPTLAVAPTLIAVTGASGLGLALRDGRYERIQLGSRGKPLLLDPGQNSLSFTLTPVRTQAPLAAGYFHASLFFYMRYD